MKFSLRRSVLTAIPAALIAGTVGAQNAVSLPAGENVEPAGLISGGEGFAISIGPAEQGASAGSPSAAAIRADAALEEADIRVTFDGLNVRRRLTLSVEETGAGDSVRVQSSLNYPDFVTRGEVRVIDLGARGGPRTVATAPVSPNGSALISLPSGSGDFALVHRVYDAQGRYDETAPVLVGSGGAGAVTDGPVSDGAGPEKGSARLPRRASRSLAAR